MNVEILKLEEGTCCWCRKQKRVVTIRFPNEQPQPFCLKDFDRMVEMKLPPGKKDEEDSPLFRDNGIPKAELVK